MGVLTSAAIIAWGAICIIWAVLLASQLRARRRGLMLCPAPPSDTDWSLPTVCVVVAARNEAEVIGAWLGGILGQDYPMAATSVVVVDDRSDDGTGDAAAAAARVDKRVHLVR